MKQADDNMTIEMYPEALEAAKTDKYRFYVVTADDNGGEHCTEWRGLSKKQARDMYAYTQAHQPWNVTKCGWEMTR